MSQLLNQSNFLVESPISQQQDTTVTSGAVLGVKGATAVRKAITAGMGLEDISKGLK